MPELPEVETIARGLHQKVKGDVITSGWLGPKPEPLKSPASEIIETLASKRILSVRRVGKHIVFDLEKTVKRTITRARARSKPPADRSQSQWIVHLGMTGRVLVCAPHEAVSKHTHAI